eukprot:scaffold649635_cov43-Prasinocladus_malaysianus.AAC.1
MTASIFRCIWALHTPTACSGSVKLQIRFEPKTARHHGQARRLACSASPDDGAMVLYPPNTYREALQQARSALRRVRADKS